MATILIIDDSEHHRAAAREALEADGDYELLEAADGLSGLQLLLKARIDVVVCDLEMPGLDGERLLRVAQGKHATRDVPFIFATGSEDLDRRVRLLEDGAHDVIGKPFHARELVARLKLHLQIKQLQDELVAKNEVLARLSTTDALTGMRNRRYIDETLNVEIMRARRYSTPLCALMADIDHFKQVNDAYGHQAGDHVLAEVGRRFLALLRTTDYASRYGGEEFLIVLTQSDAEGALEAAERWRASIADTPFELPDGQLIDVTVSVGVASYDVGMSSTSFLVAAADAALYDAKAQGRDCVAPASG